MVSLTLQAGPVGGVVRVVLVREPRWLRWHYFATDQDLSVADSVLENEVADRSAFWSRSTATSRRDARSGTAAVASCVGQRRDIQSDKYVGRRWWSCNRPRTSRRSRLSDASDSPSDKKERRPSHANPLSRVTSRGDPKGI